MGLAASLAYCVVAGFIDSRKLARRDKSCETAVQVFRSMNSPFSLHWTEYSVRCLLLFTAGYGIIALAVSSSRKNRRRGAEHGSAQWGDVFQTAKRYRDKKNPRQNLILTQHFQMGLDGHKHKRNTNVLVIGGSGAGKKPVLCDSQRFKLRGVLHGSLRSKKVKSCGKQEPP